METLSQIVVIHEWVLMVCELLNSKMLSLLSSVTSWPRPFTFTLQQLRFTKLGNN